MAALLDAGVGQAEVLLDGQLWGWLGEIDRSVSDQLDLKDAVTVAELDLQVLESATELTPAYALLPQFPAVARDLNFLLVAKRIDLSLLDGLHAEGQTIVMVTHDQRAADCAQRTLFLDKGTLSAEPSV